MGPCCVVFRHLFQCVRARARVCVRVLFYILPAHPSLSLYVCIGGGEGAGSEDNETISFFYFETVLIGHVYFQCLAALT